MTKFLKLTCFILGVQIFFAPNVYGNSYMAMLTTPPENYTPYQRIEVPAHDLYYRSNIKTKSPVMTDPAEKIAAWEYSEAHPYNPNTFKESIQNFIYAVETIAFGGLIYLFISD